MEKFLSGNSCENCGHVFPHMDYNKDLEMYFCGASCEYEYIAENVQVHEDVDSTLKEMV